MRWHVLTSRETAVAWLAADGLSTDQVAQRLRVSPDTVKTHLRHVYAKLGVRNRSELTRAVLGIREKITRTGDRQRSESDRR